MGHDVGLQVPGPQPSPGRHVHQSKVLGLVVAAGDALEAVRYLLNSSDWSIVTIKASDWSIVRIKASDGSIVTIKDSDWSPAQCWDLDTDLRVCSNQGLAPVSCVFKMRSDMNSARSSPDCREAETE